MKISVIGGAGFIGAHLCKELINNGDIVYCMDDFSTGSEKNINNLKHNKNFYLIKQDIISSIYLESIDQIYNLACPASPISYQKDPVKTIKTSILGTVNVLELANKCNSRVLQASTSEIYGDPKEHPQTENYWGNVNPIGIRSCYDEGKRCAETLFFDYFRQYNTDIVIARIFNTFGPKMKFDDGRVISNFIYQSINDKEITIYGDGKQTRSFCYIDDMVDGLIKLMNSIENGPINLGNPDEIKIIDIAKKIKKICKSKSKIVFKSLPEDDPLQRKPNIKLANSRINWKPKLDLDTGLLLTTNYFVDLK